MGLIKERFMIIFFKTVLNNNYFTASNLLRMPLSCLKGGNNEKY